MAHKVYYPAYPYWKEPLQSNFEFLLNPLEDDLGWKITLEQLQEFLTAELGDTLPFISSVVSDGVTIGGTGTDDDPLTVIASGFSDTNLFSDDLELSEDRSHDGGGFNFNIVNLLSFNIESTVSSFKGASVNLYNRTELVLYDTDNSNYASFKTPSNLTANTIYILPPNDGNLNDMLVTDGSGNLSWQEQPLFTIESISGNIVDNSDPSNPIIDQVQTDWDEADDTSPAYLANKPSIPQGTDDINNNSNITGTTATDAFNTINTSLLDFNVSLNFISVEDFPLILPYDFSIDTVDNPDALTVTITVNGSPYTLTNTITTYDEVIVSVSGVGFINLNCTKQ